MAAGKKSKTAAETKQEDVDDDGASTRYSEAEEDAATGESSGSVSGSGGDEDDCSSSSDDNSKEEDVGSSDDDDDDDSRGGADDRTAQNDPCATPSTAPADDGEEPCIFDLAHLVGQNTHQVNPAALYCPPSAASAAPDADWYARPPTILMVAGAPVANEAALLARAAAGATQLLRSLWRLPVAERTDAGPLVRLPSVTGGIKLPRALPPPPPKQSTKWEKFALQRGIAPKSKKSRKVYSEATGEWKHLTGSLANKANAGPESWPIIEVKKNDDPMADPWEKLRDEKKTRAGKNAEARTRNAELAGVLERGSAGRLARGNLKLDKQKASLREKEREWGLAAPAGVPTDMARPGRGSLALRGRPSTQLALRATQVSTASLGKFDQQREGEPEKKILSKSIHGSKKRKQEQLSEGSGDGAAGRGGANKKLLQREAQKSADILQRVMNGSTSKERERDMKRGKYAKGETAYDYEFDDGLGSGSFKKKKGRAGMGKMRKITKKRIK